MRIRRWTYSRKHTKGLLRYVHMYQCARDIDANARRIRPCTRIEVAKKHDCWDFLLAQNGGWLRTLTLRASGVSGVRKWQYNVLSIHVYWYLHGRQTVDNSTYLSTSIWRVIFCGSKITCFARIGKNVQHSKIIITGIPVKMLPPVHSIYPLFPKKGDPIFVTHPPNAA